MGRPPLVRAVQHDHQWAVDGMKVIGGVEFRIDACVVEKCAERRACRSSGPRAVPSPSRSTAFYGRKAAPRKRARSKARRSARLKTEVLPRKPGPSGRPRCEGQGRAPAWMTNAERVYRLVSGRLHRLSGRGICPVCGAEIAVLKGKLCWHYEPRA